MLAQWKHKGINIIISNMILLIQETVNKDYCNMYLKQLSQMKRQQEQTKHYQHVIFDLDGTLIDTQQAILKAWQETLREYHYHFTLLELEMVLGITMSVALQQLHVVADKRFEEKWHANYQQYASQCVYFTGVREMLLSLKAKGYQLGLVTSRKRAELQLYFSDFHLNWLFQTIICADDTKQHKPEAEPLLTYIDRADVNPAECIYIGDMLTDIECAANAHIDAGLAVWQHQEQPYIGASNIYQTPEDILKQLL